jgi:hypothetical protein
MKRGRTGMASGRKRAAEGKGDMALQKENAGLRARKYPSCVLTRAFQEQSIGSLR